MKNIDPTQTAAWQKLKIHFEEIKETHLSTLFKEDEKRFEKYSLEWRDFFIDLSKNRINDQTKALLIQLAKECGLEEAIQSMFNGEKINVTEGRAVLHTVLRDKGSDELYLDDQALKAEVYKVLAQIKTFTEDLHLGRIRGYSGKIITDLINIGIGGSDLGIAFAHEALRPYHHPGIQTHFVSNVDASNIVEVTKDLNPETCLFVIASKSFTTQETMTNAMTARSWFLDRVKDEEHISKHFVAVSTNVEKVKAFGINPKNMFVFWDWVGGRFSLSSAIGLSLACSIGYKNFEDMLEGMYQMDQHFQRTSFEENIPVLLAMISIWYNNFFDAAAEAILPYDDYLDKLALFLQQGFMESNGKYLSRAGKKVNYQTGQVLFGSAGTNGQHSFYQLIHQGTRMIPCDFIAPAISHHQVGDHHVKLLANFFAQPEALAFGTNPIEGQSDPDFKDVFRVFEGNRPTNSILIKKITPETLGSLIAMYEHKIFVQGIIWNIFSFDQWGVELGKKLAKAILPELENSATVTSHDNSTNGLINVWKRMSK